MAASVRARLLNKAKAEKQNFNLALSRYALERLLYRLNQSKYADLPATMPYSPAATSGLRD